MAPFSRAEVVAVVAPGSPVFSIGDLAERTGVAAGTLRIWESRHGFPVPQRLASGHRRYGDADVEAVLQVVRLRDSGVRLEAAIAQVRSQRDAPVGAPPAESVYARLRQAYPALQPSRLTKRTLLAMSWGIEDELSAQARPVHLFGAFQRTQFFESARARWTDLARSAASTHVFADFAELRGSDLVEVPITESSPMGREWSVVGDSAQLSVVLTAWELPGQGATRDEERVFESLWTVDPAPVREAARTCTALAVAAGSEGAVDVARELAAAPVGAPDLGAITSLFNRTVAYVDRAVSA